MKKVMRSEFVSNTEKVQVCTQSQTNQLTHSKCPTALHVEATRRGVVPVLVLETT